MDKVILLNIVKDLIMLCSGKDDLTFKEVIDIMTTHSYCLDKTEFINMLEVKNKELNGNPYFREAAQTLYRVADENSRKEGE